MRVRDVSHASTALLSLRGQGPRKKGPGLGTELCIMPDTPNAHLEVERHDHFMGILVRGLGRKEKFEFVKLCVLTVPGVHWRLTEFTLRSCGHAICMVAFFILVLSELTLASPFPSMSKPIAPAACFEASLSVAFAVCAPERRFADV